MSVAALLGKLRIDAEMHAAKIEGGVRQANSSLDRMSRKLISMQNVLLGVAGAAGFGALVSGMIDVTNKAQAWEAGMLSVTGSLNAARKEIAFVKEESNRLGISVTSATDQFVKLAAAAQGTKLEGAGVRDIFSATMEAARVFNLSIDDAEGAMRALAQMISKSTVSMEEMRQQFGERIPGAMQVAARGMGMTVEQFSKAVSQGEILAEDMLPKLAEGLRGLTKGGLEASLSVPAAEFTRMKNAIIELGQAIGESGILSFFTFLANIATRVVRGITAIVRAENEHTRALRLLREENKLQLELTRTGIAASIERTKQTLKEAEANLKLAESVELSVEDPLGEFGGVGLETPATRAVKGLREEIERMKAALAEGEKNLKDFEATAGSIGAEIGNNVTPKMEKLLPTLERTRAAIAVVPLQETMTVNVRDLGDVANIEGEAMERAAAATLAHNNALQTLGQSARGASSILSSLQTILGGFGISLGGSSGIGIAGAIPSLFGALSNPGLLIPALSGAGASALGGNTGAIAGSALGAFGGYALGTSFLGPLVQLGLLGSLGSGGLAIPIVAGLSALAGGAAGFFGGGALQSLLDKDQQPRVSFGFYPSGRFAGGRGAIGQRSVLGESAFGQFMIGGRDGQARTSEMFDIIRGIENLDKIVAGFLSPEQIRRAGAAQAGIGEITGAGAFDPAQTIWWRFRRIFDVLDDDLEELWDTFQPTQESLETFINSLGILTTLGESARTIAADFDMANQSFIELIAILSTFEEFAQSTFHDIDNMALALQRTPWQQFQDAAEDLGSAIAMFDGTEQSTRDLNTALAEFGRTELAVAQQLRRARAETANSIEAAITNVRHSGMTGAQIWNESSAGANRLLANLQAGRYTDPAAIQAASNQALSLFNTGWNALSQEQRAAAQQDSLQFLNALQSASDIAFQSVTTRMEGIHNEMANSITTAMGRAADEIVGAARNSERALTTAANNLNNVSVNVNVDTSEING